MMNEHVSSIMTKSLITVSPNQSLEDVKSLFLKTRIHHLPVVENDEVKGIVTTYDLWKLDLPFEDYASTKVSEVMTTNIAKLEPKDKIGTAAEVFLDNRFHALPIVEDNKLVGLITSFDVLKYNFKKEYPRTIMFDQLYAGKNQNLLQHS